MRGEILSISVVSRPSGDPYLTISRISIILSKLATTTTTTDTPWIPPPPSSPSHTGKKYGVRPRILAYIIMVF